MSRFPGSCRAGWQPALVALLLLCSAAAVANEKRVSATSTSMEPTLEKGTVFLVDETAYLDARPARGDIVIFKSPADGSFHAYRVIGLPGERLGYGVDGRITLGGVRVGESRVDKYPHGERFDLALFTEDLPGARHPIYKRSPEHAEPDAFPALANERSCVVDAMHAACTVPAGHYFLLGDNRPHAEDSRFIGFIDGSEIYGRVSRGDVPLTVANEPATKR